MFESVSNEKSATFLIRSINIISIFYFMKHFLKLLNKLISFLSS